MKDKQKWLPYYSILGAKASKFLLNKFNAIKNAQIHTEAKQKDQFLDVIEFTAAPLSLLHKLCSVYMSELINGWTEKNIAKMI